MEKSIELNGKYTIVNNTNNKKKNLVGYTILNDTISVGEELIIRKGEKIKRIEIDIIRKTGYDSYHLSNSNISVIIKLDN